MHLSLVYLAQNVVDWTDVFPSVLLLGKSSTPESWCELHLSCRKCFSQARLGDLAIPEVVVYRG